MIWCCLCEIGPVQAVNLVKVRDQTQSSSVALEQRFLADGLYISSRIFDLTEVAREPVLQTVRTFKLWPDPPFLLVSSISQSPPHFAICLFLVTSSAAISSPSAIKSLVTTLGDFTSSIEVCNVRVSRRVAAPKFTAVGRAVYKKSRISVTCNLRASVDERKCGGGVSRSARDK